VKALQIGLRRVLWPLAIGMFAVGCATTPPAPSIDEGELASLGFKQMVASTTAQKEWIQTLPAGKIRAMQRNGKKYFIYPDSAKNQIYIGGPEQYAAYQARHPGTTTGVDETAARVRNEQMKSDQSMEKATARDLSDPFLGADWYGFVW
jgi:hypothetical protein